MTNDDPEIEIGPVQSRQRGGTPRPGAPQAIVGQVGTAQAQREIFLHVRVIEEIMASLPQGQSREAGGLLVGSANEDEVGPYLLLIGAIAAQRAASTSLSVTFTHEAWEQLLAEKAALYPDQPVVGWYHTHPSLGIFLSQQDLFIHRNFFAEPTHVALVVDPTDFSWGIFYWQDEELVAAQGCYLYAELGESYQRLVQSLGDYEVGTVE